MVMFSAKTVLAAKVEGTPGTIESLANSEGAFNVYNPKFSQGMAVTQRQAQGGFNKLAPVPGARPATISFETDIGWDGTATLPTWATVFFPACGWVNSSGTFSPKTEAPGSNVKTLTLATYVDGVKRVLFGAMGNWRIELIAGTMARVFWEFTGIYSPTSDVSILTPTYPTAQPLRYVANELTYNSLTPIANQVVFDAGNTVILREDGTQLSGYKTALITDRNPTVTISPEAVLVATEDRYGDFFSATGAALTCEIAGEDTSTISIGAGNAFYQSINPGDRNGVVTDDIVWSCNKDTSNDNELTITFTETV